MFEEVKEMIDSTIYTNGRGEVTAQNINLAMHGMVEATEEELGKVNDAVKTVEDKVTALEENGTGGGTGALRVWINEENTPEQVAENAATYTALKNNIAQQVCFVSTPILDPDTLEAVVYTSNSVESIQRADSDNGFYLAIQFITDNDGTIGAIRIAILLLEDGTLEYVS